MLAPFHYFGVTEYTDDRGNVIDETSNLATLVRNTRVDHIVNALQTYGHSGAVRGLIFCSRREEAVELSKLLNLSKVNGSRLRTVELSGEDDIAHRERVVERLERGELDYILTCLLYTSRCV